MAPQLQLQQEQPQLVPHLQVLQSQPPASVAASNPPELLHTPTQSWFSNVTAAAAGGGNGSIGEDETNQLRMTIPAGTATYALLVAAAMTMVVVLEPASTSGNILQLHIYTRGWVTHTHSSESDT
jgi:hypothetical protein